MALFQSEQTTSNEQIDRKYVCKVQALCSYQAVCYPNVSVVIHGALASGYCQPYSSVYHWIS